MDAAEVLFAKEGYHGTSVRAITSKAHSHIASINYHFGSKEELLKALFERKLIPINTLRLKMLDEALKKAVAKNKKPVLEDVIRAFIEPIFKVDFTSRGVRNISSIMDMSFAQEDSSVGRIFHEIMRPVFMRFFKAFKMTLPEMKEQDLMFKVHFMLGSMLHTIRVCFKSPLSNAAPMHKFKDINPEMVIERLVNFCVAGLKAK